MEWLNFHHLRYFWAVAREGGVTRASERLNISQPTVSAQVRELEDALGEPLFVREGRTLRLTEVGQVAYRYADEIFGLGQELVDTVRGRPTGRPLRLVVGVADAVPKLVAHHLLAPALRLPEPVQIVCFEDKTDRLLMELASHALDVVIADVPVGSAVRVKAYDHLLGECAVEVFGTEALVAPRRRGFPGSLDGAPFLLPTRGATLRRELEEWFDAHKVRPHVTGEFEDNALLEVFGQEGRGLFAAPAAIAREVRRQHKVVRLGRLDGLQERFYAISVERRLKHPAVVALSQAARHQLFRSDS
jgi:LysR family transcriptional activator of nhaA